MKTPRIHIFDQRTHRAHCFGSLCGRAADPHIHFYPPNAPPSLLWKDTCRTCYRAFNALNLKGEL